MPEPTKLSNEEKRQHKHVLSVVKDNLDLVIDQIESLDNSRYDSLLEELDTAKKSLSGLY